MIDFIKINNLIKGRDVRNLLDFDVLVNEKTGEMYSGRKRSACHKNLIFTYVPGVGQVKLQGSIHKFANDGETNDDRFDLNRFIQVSDELVNYISPDDRINVIEFGVNVETPFNPSLLIKNLIASTNKPFKSDIRSGRCSSQAEYSQYIVKIYDKGLQQRELKKFILRFEVKVLKMGAFFKTGLTWGDLSKKETWETMGNILEKKFSEIVYFDPHLQAKKIPLKELAIIENGNNPFYWRDLKGPHVSRIRKNYISLIEKYGNTFSGINRLIKSEVELLVNPDRSETSTIDQEVVNSDQSVSGTKEVNLVNSDQSEISSTDTEMVNSDQSGLEIDDNKMVKSDPLLYGQYPSKRISYQDIKRCSVTGIDIWMQKDESRFLSITGIRYLYKNNRELYNKLLSEIPLKYHTTSREGQEYKIAHHIRDKFFNPRNSIRRAIKKLFSEPSLFDNRLLISEGKYKIANKL